MQVFEDFRRSVVFFGKQSPIGGEIKYGGTGFLLVDDFGGDPVPLVITARHVAKQLEDDFFVRINKHGGESIPLPIPSPRWCHHPDESVDVSALIHIFDPRIYDCTYFGTRMIMPYSSRKISCGDRINLVGLFRLHAGSKRNVPIVHTGHIAAVPDENEKIPITDRTTGKTVRVVSYLVEAQTLDGLSGSPVVSYQHTQKGTQAKILGIYQGSWDGEPGKILAEDRNLSNNRIRVPVGIGLVVPGEKIIELIRTHPDIQKERERQRHARLSAAARKRRT